MKASLMGSVFLLAGTTAFAQEIQFEEVTAKAFSTTPSGHDHIQNAIFTDFNNDGYPDLLIAGGNRPLLFLTNQHDGTFAPVDMSLGTSLVASALLPADFDNDGYVDLAVLTARGECRLLQSGGGNAFTDITTSSGLPQPENYRAAAAGDFNNDGSLDLMLFPFEGGARLFLQDFSARFHDASGSAGLEEATNGTHVLACDLDSDRDADLVILRGEGNTHLVYENDGHARFTERTKTWATAGYDPGAFGGAVSDVDNDGRLDLLLLRESSPPAFGRNKGGRFQPESQAFAHRRAFLPRSAVFADFDNDGRADLLAAGAHGLQIHRNLDGVSFFQPSAFTLSTDEVRVTAIADIDLDGRLDVFAAGENGAMRLFKNNSTPEGRWFSALLVGKPGNRNGFGARLSFWTNGIPVRQCLTPVSGYGGSVDNRRVHVGLGESTRLDSIIIEWPSGEQGRFYQKLASRHMVFREGDSEVAAVFDGQFVDISTSAGIGGIAEHGGHAILFADVNGDRREDMYVTHTNFVPGSNSEFLVLPDELFINNGNNTFIERAMPAGVDDPGQSHGAVWVDIDNDGDFDLFNGQRGPSGNRLYRNNGNGDFTEITSPAGILLSDRRTISVLGLDIENDGDMDLFSGNWGLGNEMYVNDGTGNFTNQNRGLFDLEPDAAGTTGVTAADIDNDGDLDIFLGKRDDTCRLYINDGTGNFTDRAAARGVAFNGASNGAVFFDMDRDADLDLLLAVSSNNGSSNGELTKLRVYRNRGNGNFDDETNAQNITFEGYTLNTGDVDNDGDDDIFQSINFGMSSLWLNDGTGNFTQQSNTGLERNGVDARATTLGDIDNDGDLDIAITYIQEPTFLFRNDLNTSASGARNFLQIAVASPGGSAGGWGTKFYLYEAGHLDQQSFLRGYRQITSVQGTLSGNSPVVHFGVDPNTTYDLRVRYLDGSSRVLTNLAPGQRIDLESGNDTTPPVISAVAATALLPTGATLTWSTDEPATSQVEFGTTAALGTFTPLDSAMAQSHSVVLGGLSSGTTYFYRVISVDVAGNSAGSATASFVTTLSGPLLSDDFSGSSLDANKWTLSSHAGNLSAVSNGTLRLRSTSNSSGWVHTRDRFSTRNKTVQLKVVQASNDGALGMSPTVTTASPNGFYDEPAWYRFYNYRSGSSGPYLLFVQWKRNGVVDGLDVAAGVNFTGNFHLRIRTDDTRIFFEYSFNGTTWTTAYSETFTLPGYTLDDLYAFELSAYDTPSKGEWVVDDFVINSIGAPPTPDTTPPVISNVASGNITASSATITWNTDEPSDTQVEYGPTTSYGSQSSLSTNLVTAHSITLNSLSASTTYHYRVKSRDTAGNLATSNDFAFTTQADATPPIISNVTTSNITSSASTITWNTNEASDSQAEYGLTPSYGSQSALDANRVTAHSITLNGLSANTTYHYRVKCSDAAGNLAVSNDFTFTTTSSAGGPIFSEDFTGSSINSNKWNRGTNSGNQTRVSNNQLQLRSSSTQTGWVATKQAFTARNTIVAVKVVQPNDDGNLGMSPTYNLSSNFGIYSEANWYRFYTYRDQSSGPYLLFVQWKKSGVEGGLDVTGNLNITGTVYLRLRIDDTDVHFEASLNAQQWQEVYREAFALPGYTLNSAFYYELAAYRTSSKGVMIVDDFSISSTSSALAKRDHEAQVVQTPPAAFALSQTYPNPFQFGTHAQVAMPEEAKVHAVIYDLAGRTVQQLYQGQMPAGNREIAWDGTNASGQHVSSGVYFLRVILETPAGRRAVFTRQLQLIR